MPDKKEILDRVARALHPHWPEGSRNAYIPDQLPDMVNDLITERDSLITERDDLKRYINGE